MCALIPMHSTVSELTTSCVQFEIGMWYPFMRVEKPADALLGCITTYVFVVAIENCLQWIGMH